MCLNSQSPYRYPVTTFALACEKVDQPCRALALKKSIAAVSSDCFQGAQFTSDLVVFSSYTYVIHT